MDKSHPAFHSFKVAPKSLEWSDSKNVSNQQDKNQSRGTAENPGPFWTEFLVFHNQYKPESKDYFHYYPESKSFAGDVWEKHRIGDDEWHYQERINTGPDGIL
jgi:hypothetical protein